MKKKQHKNLTLKDVDTLLARQTVVILNAVDEKLENNRREFKREIDRLRISVDKFVGFYTKVVKLEAKLT